MFCPLSNVAIYSIVPLETVLQSDVQENGITFIFRLFGTSAVAFWLLQYTDAITAFNRLSVYFRSQSDALHNVITMHDVIER